MGNNLFIKSNYKHIKRHGSGIYYVDSSGIYWYEKVAKIYWAVISWDIKFKVKINYGQFEKKYKIKYQIL